ncbi:MAG: helix-turn-helix transcriptional regulator [Roseiflexaceae bacterium]|nr:helix-turn-helix transcriptional regulator [Roseiflexaceae bacterium]
MQETISPELRALGSRCCIDLPPPVSADHAQELAQDFQILGHPVRLQLLAVLAQNPGKICVCDLEAALPIKQPTVSHHLRLLREAGLVDCERHGQWAYYVLKHDAMTALQGRVGSVLHLLT